MSRRLGLRRWWRRPGNASTPPRDAFAPPGFSGPPTWRFGRVRVQNGEGATEPLIYQEEGSGRDIFIFQYAFQEGGPPAPAGFERALRCWKRPQSRGCDMGD